MKKVVLTVIITLAAVAVLGILYNYSGMYDVAVANRDTGISRWVFKTTMEHSVASRAEDITAPSLDDPAMIEAGFRGYQSMCSGCHGAPGKTNEGPAENFNPAPPFLPDEEEEWSPSELFWIIKHGVKMSAMPAFGNHQSDEEIWNIVAFMRQLPGMTSDEYRAFSAPKMNTDADTHQGEDPHAGHEH